MSRCVRGEHHMDSLLDGIRHHVFRGFTADKYKIPNLCNALERPGDGEHYLTSSAAGVYSCQKVFLLVMK